MTEFDREAVRRYVVAVHKAMWKHQLALEQILLTRSEWERLTETREQCNRVLKTSDTYFAPIKGEKP